MLLHDEHPRLVVDSEGLHEVNKESVVVIFVFFRGKGDGKQNVLALVVYSTEHDKGA